MYKMELATGSYGLSAYITAWLLLYVESYTLSSSIEYTSSEVGRQATLPCTLFAYMSSLAQTPYIQWQTVSHTVFERMGDEQFQGESFENRVDVSMEMLAEGNCSLILSDVHFRDAGTYESYLLVGQWIKSRILIQTVQLTVFDHKHMQTVERGKDLILDLRTNQAKMVLFHGNGVPEWSMLWESGQGRGRLRGAEEREGMLVVPGVEAGDSGIYRVMDSEGLVLSTVKVSVKESIPTNESKVEEQPSLGSGSGRVDAPSLCLTAVLLLSSLNLLRLR